MSAENVRCTGLSKVSQDAKQFASHLARKALRRRERNEMRIDDISVMVIDVNPKKYIGKIYSE